MGWCSLCFDSVMREGVGLMLMILVFSFSQGRFWRDESCRGD